jgi:hypothetical protein
VVIKVRYSSIDRYRETRSFSTLKGARRFAQKWIGENPEMGSTYAVSGDGIGKIEMEWLSFEPRGVETPVTLADLFGPERDTRPFGVVFFHADDGVTRVTTANRRFATAAEAHQFLQAAIDAGQADRGQVNTADGEQVEPTDREMETALYGRGPHTVYLPDYAPDAPGYGERVWNDDETPLATPADACREYARNMGGECPDQEWLLTSYDTWERNPHYTGKPGRHPEDDYQD